MCVFMANHRGFGTLLLLGGIALTGYSLHVAGKGLTTGVSGGEAFVLANNQFFGGVGVLSAILGLVLVKK